MMEYLAMWPWYWWVLAFLGYAMIGVIFLYVTVKVAGKAVDGGDTSPASLLLWFWPVVLFLLVIFMSFCFLSLIFKNVPEYLNNKFAGTVSPENKTKPIVPERKCLLCLAQEDLFDYSGIQARGGGWIGLLPGTYCRKCFLKKT